MWKLRLETVAQALTSSQSKSEDSPLQNQLLDTRLRNAVLIILGELAVSRDLSPNEQNGFWKYLHQFRLIADPIPAHFLYLGT